MENKKIVIGNMKMNLTLDEVKEYILEMEGHKDCIICPSYLYLPYFIESGFEVGTQDISEYGMGAYTGEISVNQVRSMNIEYTIIGHSERRDKFNEDDDIINRKVSIALSNNMKVILCIGETLEEKVLGKTQNKLEEQLVQNLHDIEETYYENIIIAYEPVWAIGTGKVPSEEEIKNNITYIKQFIKQEYNFEPKVLYGGSTNEKNIEQLNKINIVDGFLVGGACLIPEKFKKIIETIR